MVKKRKVKGTVPVISEDQLNRVIDATKMAIKVDGVYAKKAGINNDKVLEILELLRGETNTTAVALATTLFLILPAGILTTITSMLDDAIQTKLIMLMEKDN